jgi:hypothetical protein
MSICEGVTFNKIAREWRCKWTGDEEKQSLIMAQKTLAKFMDAIKELNGFVSVQRIVCGSCNDFKVIVSLSADAWAGWELAKFAPEEEFLSSLKEITGLSAIETQTYTIMTL